jgi:hypothetical protein
MASSGLAEVRTWTGNNGVSLDAEFVRLQGDGVSLVLRKRDGSLIQTKTYHLSSDDQAFLNALVAGIRAAQSAEASEQPRLQPETQAQSVRPALKQTTALHSTRKPQSPLPKNPMIGVNEDEDQQENLRDAARHRIVQADDDEAILFDQPGQWQRQNIPGVNRRQQQVPNPLLPPLGRNDRNQVLDAAKDETARWEKQQAEQERWTRQQEQDRIRREKQELESEAWRLQNRIRNTEHDSRPDYSGLSSKANRLSQDADRLGEDGASWQFRRAASALREADREQSSWNSRSSAFGSREDEKRDEAQRNVWSGRGSINTFDSGSSLNRGSSFNNGTSMDSW